MFLQNVGCYKRHMANIPENDILHWLFLISLHCRGQWDITVFDPEVRPTRYMDIYCWHFSEKVKRWNKCWNNDSVASVFNKYSHSYTWNLMYYCCMVLHKDCFTCRTEKIQKHGSDHSSCSMQFLTITKPTSLFHTAWTKLLTYPNL
jgi:hypothetical protein